VAHDNYSLSRVTESFNWFSFQVVFFLRKLCKVFPECRMRLLLHMWCSLNSCTNNCKLFNSFTVFSFPRNLSLKRVTIFLVSLKSYFGVSNTLTSSFSFRVKLEQVMLDSLLSSSNLKKLSKTILGLFWNVSNCFNGVEMWLKNLQGNVRLPIMSKTLKKQNTAQCARKSMQTKLRLPKK